MRHARQLSDDFLRSAERNDLLREELRLGPDEQIDAAVRRDEREGGERVGDAALCTNRLIVLVVIAAHKLELGVLLREIVEERRNLLARLAPRRVEVDNELPVRLEQLLVVRHARQLDDHRLALPLRRRRAA